MSIKYVDYEEYEKALEPLVLNILVYLRASGIISGPIFPTHRTRQDIEPKHHLPSVSGDGSRIEYLDRLPRKRHVVPAQPQSISFYEGIRPTFEQAYDAIGLSWPQALALDTNLYFKCVANGPSAETVEKFLNFCERQQRQDVVMSLEEVLETRERESEGYAYTVEKDIHPLETDSLGTQALRAVQAWGKPPTVHPVDTKVVLLGKHTGFTSVRLGSHKVMECDVCKKPAGLLYKAGGERCSKCLAAYNRERATKHKSVVYYSDRERLIYR